MKGVTDERGVTRWPNGAMCDGAVLVDPTEGDEGDEEMIEQDDDDRAIYQQLEEIAETLHNYAHATAQLVAMRLVPVSHELAGPEGHLKDPVETVWGTWPPHFHTMRLHLASIGKSLDSIRALLDAAGLCEDRPEQPEAGGK